MGGPLTFLYPSEASEASEASLILLALLVSEKRR